MQRLKPRGLVPCRPLWVDLVVLQAQSRSLPRRLHLLIRALVDLVCVVAPLPLDLVLVVILVGVADLAMAILT